MRKTADENQKEMIDMNRNVWEQLPDLIQKEYDNIRGLVIIRNGSIIHESYYGNKGPDDCIHVASVTKSILSALIGIAVKHGYIDSIDRKVMEFFPEFTFTDPNKTRSRITLKHLLTMTAPYPYEDWQEPLESLCTSSDWVRFTLNMLGKGGETGAFKYSTASAHLLSAVLSRTTGKSAREFANEMLFRPIGMRSIPDYPMDGFGYEDLFGAKLKGWPHDPHGITIGGWGLTMTPRDMARFGLLYLNNGCWDGNEILPQSWVRASAAATPHQYGYMWWLFQEKGISAFAAMGDGGNAIFCIPQLDMVAAIASAFIPQPKDRWILIKEHILPAVVTGSFQCRDSSGITP